MYAVLNVVFGVAWESSRKTQILDEACEEEITGFNCPYNGGGDGWSYFGLDIDGFDECCLTYLDEQDWAVKPELEAQYEAMIEAIDDDAIKAAVRALGKPRMVIVPSTS